MSSIPNPDAATERNSWQRAWPILKWLLFAVMVWFVAQRGRELWQTDQTVDLTVHWGWLVPAAITYWLGWLPAVWFWRRMMRSLGQRVSRFDAIRAYYCGHLGKYVPGKATVLVIRAALLKDRGCRPAIAALTAGYETLTTMGAGAAIAVALAPLAVSPSLWEQVPSSLRTLRTQPVLLPIAVVILTIAVMPLVSRLFSRVALKLLPPEMRREDRNLKISTSLLLRGLPVLALMWVLHSVSLGCTLQSVSDTPLDWSGWPAWLAAVSLATFLGFVVLIAPGGVGVREYVLIESLRHHPGISSQQAVLAALLLRGVWFATEILAAAVLYWLPARDKTPG